LERCMCSLAEHPAKPVRELGVRPEFLPPEEVQGSTMAFTDQMDTLFKASVSDEF
jgi:hypothetical protein